ncbi:MAG: hypothetical protein KJ043_05190 [Anaerolineae bacterium]|nr:hypothetical protein [Anaerolineae bacterium]
MADKRVEISDYYELIALYRALHVARFLADPPVPELLGSPFIAKIAIQVAEALNEWEIARGHAEQANWRKEIPIDSSLWIIVRDNIIKYSQKWDTFSEAQKRDYIQDCLSPFLITDEVMVEFIRQADNRT